MKIDFHIHTHHSYDSLMKPAKILRIAKARGLDGIVICDHNTIRGGMETAQLNRDTDFLVIVGAEIATDAGDITGIYLSQEIESREFNQVVAEIKQQGGKVILNHPYKGHDLAKIDYSKIDFIEGNNSRLNAQDNLLARELARTHGIPVLSGSDAHVYAEIANCYTEVSDPDSLNPLRQKYSPSKKIHVTRSQYVKAFKRRSLRTFYSATAVQIKYSLRKIFRKDR